MALSLKHAFHSNKGDGTDATFVQPSNWNEEHALMLAARSLVGRLTDSPGAAEEVPMSAFVASLLSAASAEAFVALLGNGMAQTGDIRLSIDSDARTGWVVANDSTLGDSLSGASYTGDTCKALYQLIWNKIADAYCPVVGGRGTDALTDYNAHKRITLPRTLGRSLSAAGSGAGLTARVHGSYTGNETFSLTTANLPPYTPSGYVTVNGTPNGSVSDTWFKPGTFSGVANSAGTTPNYWNGLGGIELLGSYAMAFAGVAQGGTATAFSTTHPVIFLYAHFKL